MTQFNIYALCSVYKDPHKLFSLKISFFITVTPEEDPAVTMEGMITVERARAAVLITTVETTSAEGSVLDVNPLGEDHAVSATLAGV